MLSSVVKIEEFTSKDKANEFLALGWKLIGYYTTAADTEAPAAYHQKPHFVLGWSNGEPVYPEKPLNDDPW